jgi:excinuclease ABC subunit C
MTPEETTKTIALTPPLPPPDPAPEPGRPEPAWARRVRGEAENRPGVYRFLGPRGEVLYVGKSVQLRTRLLSWLRGGDGKAAELLRVTREVAWSYRASEFEAILDEFREIRRLRPRFNVVHRRDRRFAWIRLTDEPAPRLVATLAPSSRSTRRGAGGGPRLFGPFPASRSLPRALDELAREAGLRDCAGDTPIRFADQGDLFPSPDSTPLPCPRHAFGTCDAPCAAGCTEAEYARRVGIATEFLRGESDALLRTLDARMREAAGRSDFELAARLRDRHQRLDGLRARIEASRQLLETLTFVYRKGSPQRHHLIRHGQVLATFDPPPPGAGGLPERQGLRERLEGLLQDGPLHPATLDDEAREELFLVARWFRDHPPEPESCLPVSDYLRGLGGLTPP